MAQRTITRQIDYTALCQRGTERGEAARESRFGFAPCSLERGHSGDCDSGPVAPVGPVPPRAA
jgi:hypothetical protein